MLVAEVGILKLSYALVDSAQNALDVLLFPIVMMIMMVNTSFRPGDFRILVHEGRHF